MNPGIILMAIILPPCVQLVFAVLRRKRNIAEKKMTNGEFTVMLPRMTVSIGVTCASVSALVILGFTLFSSEIPHIIFYVTYGLLFWLGTHLTIKALTFKVVVEGLKITVYSAFSRPYSFTFREITSVVRQVKNNKVKSERMIIRTSKKRLVVENSEISYKRFAAKIKAETNSAYLSGF